MYYRVIRHCHRQQYCTHTHHTTTTNWHRVTHNTQHTTRQACCARCLFVVVVCCVRVAVLSVTMIVSSASLQNSLYLHHCDISLTTSLQHGLNLTADYERIPFNFISVTDNFHVHLWLSHAPHPCFPVRFVWCVGHQFSSIQECTCGAAIHQHITHLPRHKNMEHRLF